MSELIDRALAHATDTKRVVLRAGASDDADKVYRELFGDRKAIVVADKDTWRVQGERVHGALERLAVEPFVFRDEALYAEHRFVERLEAHLKTVNAIPVSVGSGTINDLVKLAAHRVGRPYLCVATAASMDGYTAFGASITSEGSKQTFSCPAPRGVVADLDFIARAPASLGASGYADLLAKVTAGADWILADALGVEALDPLCWELVQKPLRASLSDPRGVARGDPRAIELLMEGLLMGGFAMQAHQSSRPASGAEHQFSHLWDMEHATDASHGFKVGIATLAVTQAYEALLEMPIEKLSVERAAAGWPSLEEIHRDIARLYETEEVAAKARQEAAAKYVDQRALTEQLQRLVEAWPALKEKLRGQLILFDEVRRMLNDAGAPTRSREIGISDTQLRASFRKALHIRRRFTLLDLADRCGILERVADNVALD
jgi:glycerol-1-phosphate dehydrogenase [NAD(P)+]